MPRRHLLTADAGATLALAGRDLSPTLATVMHVGGPVDGAMMPVRKVAGRLPDTLRWFAVGRSWTYRRRGRTYRLETAGPTLTRSTPRACSTCGGTMAGEGDGVYWCAANRCAAGCR